MGRKGIGTPLTVFWKNTGLSHCCGFPKGKEDWLLKYFMDFIRITKVHIYIDRKNDMALKM